MTLKLVFYYKVGFTKNRPLITLKLVFYYEVGFTKNIDFHIALLFWVWQPWSSRTFNCYSERFGWQVYLMNKNQIVASWNLIIYRIKMIKFAFFSFENISILEYFFVEISLKKKSHLLMYCIWLNRLLKFLHPRQASMGMPSVTLLPLIFSMGRSSRILCHLRTIVM